MSTRVVGGGNPMRVISGGRTPRPISPVIHFFERMIMDPVTKRPCQFIKCPNNQSEHCQDPNGISIDSQGRCVRAVEIIEMGNYGSDSCGDLAF